MSIDAELPEWTEAEGAELKGLLLGSSLRVAVAESLTVGRMQALIGATSGASGYFSGGVTTYTGELKQRLLDVDPKGEADQWVSQAVAEEMAEGVCWMFECEMGVATTGYAEPDAGKGVKSPFAWWAVCGPDGVEQSSRVEGAGLGRTQMQAKVAVAALRGLLAVLRAKQD